MASEIDLFLPRGTLGTDAFTPVSREVLSEIRQLSKRSGKCSASSNHFATRLNVSVRTVNRALLELENDGWISRSGRPRRNLHLTEAAKVLFVKEPTKKGETITEAVETPAETIAKPVKPVVAPAPAKPRPKREAQLDLPEVPKVKEPSKAQQVLFAAFDLPLPDEGLRGAWKKYAGMVHGRRKGCPLSAHEANAEMLAELAGVYDLAALIEYHTKQAFVTLSSNHNFKLGRGSAGGMPVSTENQFDGRSRKRK